MIRNGLAATLPSRPASVGAIRSAAERFAASCRLSEEETEAIKTAVSEAATNAIVHGYGDLDGEVKLTAELSERHPSRPDHRRRTQDAPPSRNRRLCLGLPLMSTWADHLNIISPTPSGGTEIQMHFGASERAGP